MKEEKLTGSYYTPHNLVTFMVDYLEKENQDFTRVLEPSAGDGRFLSLLLSKSEHIVAIEVFEKKVRQMEDLYCESNVDILQSNFLEYAMKVSERYSLVIGNPPYISPKVMNKQDISLAKALCKKEGLMTSAMQNMWLAFVIGACRVLMPKGAIFFVLPMEFLQVQYAEKLRYYLEKRFNAIHIISFQKSIFSNIEQEICLVYLTNKAKSPPHILYEIYDDTENRELLSTNIIKKNKPLQKWSNAILSDENISLLKNKSANYIEVGDMGTIAPGIVTGGNKYFILTPEAVAKYECRDFVLPILQKSSFVFKNTIAIDEAVMERIKEKNKPMYLLNLSGIKDPLPDKLNQYLNWAGKENVQGEPLKERYKCAKRNPWYGVPIVKKGGVIFFKRYGILPKIYANQADVHTTDAGYHIRLNTEYEKESLVFCFYNSLTLAQCEYNGRYYGGGVKELVPSEFKEITVPYRKIEENNICKLKRMFLEQATTDEIIQFVNSKTIALDMQKSEVKALEDIRLKLMERRIGKTEDYQV